MGAVLPLKLDASTNLSAEMGSGDYLTPAAFNDQTGTTYTLALSDAANGIRCTNAGAVTVTIPANAIVALPRYVRIPIRQGGAGAVTSAGASGVTLNSPNGAATTALGDARVLEQTDIDTWTVW